MLLKHLYDFAQSRRLLDDLAFTPKTVRWIIELNENGDLLGGGPQITGDDKRGIELNCPQTTRPKVAGGVAEFLADGITAVFGLDTDPDAKMPPAKRSDRDSNNAAKQADFWLQIADAQKESFLPELTALLAFREKLPSLIPQLFRWGTAPDAKSGTKSAWWLKTASGSEARLGPENFSFRVNGRLVLENETVKEFWRKRYASEASDAAASYPKAVCMISARADQPIPPTNPKIKGVPNTQAFGASIISFDKDAFASYGFVQNLNAPISAEPANAYCVALNWMLQRDDHSLRLGQSSLCFWARQTEKAGSFVSQMLNKPDPLAVSDFLKSPWSGIERDIARKDQFFAITLVGNSGRIAVRHWLQEPLEATIEHFHKWFEDLAIDIPARPQPKIKKAAKENSYHPLSIYWLANTTVREAKDLSPEIPSQLYRAALEGTAPSLSLIKPILDQLHSKLVRDENYKKNMLYDQSRFALLKLILNRNRKENTMEIKPTLTADTDDPAYNCGRLLAIFDDLQQRSHEWKLEGATIIERYFSSASTSPMTAFGILWRLHFHHLKKLTRLGDKGKGAAHAIELKIADVCARFGQNDEMRKTKSPPSFPRTLDLQGQGRFALGYYQEVAANATARQSAKSKTNETETK